MKRYLRFAVIGLALALLALPLGQEPIFDIGEDVALVAATIAPEFTADIEFATATPIWDDALHTTMTLDNSHGSVYGAVSTLATGFRSAQPQAVMGSGYDVLKMPLARGTRTDEMVDGAALPEDRLRST